MRMKMEPNRAILDGDIIAYQTAFWAEANDPDKFPKKLKTILKKWIPNKIKDCQIALSCSREENFRRKIWNNYKINRENMYTPEYLRDIKDYIHYNYDTISLPTLEADDVLGIYASSNEAISVTIDKDLLGVPGWHYNPNKDKDLRFITKEEAERFFHLQWMTGDSTDGIPGLWRIGPKRATKMLDEWDESEWDENIIELYSTDKHKVRNDCGISHPDIALAMARCVNILTKDTYDLETNEIKLWDPKVGS